MNKAPLDTSSSIDWLNSGKILVHPTESIWGLGCDAFNKTAVNNIFKLKKRDKKKKFILLASSIDSVEKNLCYLSKTDKEYLSDYWPGPYTFLIKYKENIPNHLKNDTNKLAIRVSNHLPLIALFKTFNGFIVSTSANISGKKNINDAHNIIDFFEYDDLAYYDESLGENNSTSKIIDLESKAIIRA